MSTTLSLELIDEALSGAFAAFRLRQHLQPAGGPGTKVFPPTFAGGVYCWETRKFGAEEKACVILDQVASQANRLEEALEEAVEDGRIDMPRLVVKMGEHYPEIGDISTLRAPHRIFDAILRDSAHDGEPFFKTDLYQAFACASQRDATALLKHAPTTLVFGAWDSTGSAGGLGNKFARSLTSEIVGVGASPGGNEGGVRRDPLGISSKVEISRPKDDAKIGEWSAKGNVLDGEKLRKDQKPSSINHSNILITANRAGDLPLGGGVTVEYALHTVVISLAQLRRLRFPKDGSDDRDRNLRGRAVLAALALAAIALNRDHGYSLRSRCDLVGDGTAPLEMVRSDGTIEKVELTTDAALAAYADAVENSIAAALPWHPEPIELEPQEKLIELVRLSRLAERGVA